MWSIPLLNNWNWQKEKKVGIFPKARSGISFCVDKKRIIFFGGVIDNESDDQIQSQFFNDMYTFHMDSKRWFLLSLHKKSNKKKSKKSNKQENQNIEQNIEDNQQDELLQEGETIQEQTMEDAEDDEVHEVQDVSLRDEVIFILRFIKILNFTEI
jgi:hypothetical protein